MPPGLPPSTQPISQAQPQSCILTGNSPMSLRTPSYGVFLLLISAAMPLVSAAPAITSVQNAASNIVPGLPNSGIAQGAIFVIKGSGLGPANISIAPAA